ncbi:hypothetical protein [Deinococcus aquiradiocola]|uniref:Uncharacterized protein n=1 Tax=Deinococcus aquiradiocola TaxID=393059 RepID=A0A917PRB9_9DEIO|nr:hypothetical protein [Deinococcus aquiradiocola]GGJ88452.1 hypothetical protein GCM10008939_35690 [Deinococcus aquiradiocola]
MRLVNVWSDLYGSTLGLYAGRAGGHRWLVASPPELAGDLAAHLEALDGKGETTLLVHAGLTPLRAALEAQLDPVLGRPLSGVVVVAGASLAGGPAMTVTEGTVDGADGLTWLEGGQFPAWQDALGAPGEEGENAAASVCAALGVPVRVCSAQDLPDVLRGWWTVTPHAFVPGG